VCYNEINNGLFNGYVSHFVNFILNFKIFINLEKLIFFWRKLIMTKGYY
jgi:hypothetical protein